MFYRAAIWNFVLQYPIIFAKAPRDPEKYKQMEESYEFLNKFLENQDFVAGDNLTIADLSIIACVSTAKVTVSCNGKRCSCNVNIWMNNTSEVSNFI
jgi:glutathione S-transferase